MTMTRKICVNGSRTFQGYDLLEATLDSLMGEDQPEFVLGGAFGADKLAEMYAAKRGIPVKIKRPNWDFFGKKAGILRNIEMIDQVDELISFWDGESKGTKHAIDYAESKGKKVTIIKVQNESKETYKTPKGL